MSVVAISMCKDEVDVAVGLVLHTLGEVDAMIVADNMSTDGTYEQLLGLETEHSDRLIVVRDPVVAYTQSDKMTALAELAAVEFGQPGDPPWIVPVDFDELWASPGGRLRDVLPGLPHPVVIAKMFNHIATTKDVDDPDPFRSMVWRQDRPNTLDKVAFRYERGARIGQGNHEVHLPSGPVGGLQVALIRHFPLRSLPHFHGKARNGKAAYDAAPEEVRELYGQHWQSYGAMTDEQRAEVWAKHWYKDPPDEGDEPPPGPVDEIRLIRDPAPYRRWETAG